MKKNLLLLPLIGMFSLPMAAQHTYKKYFGTLTPTGGAGKALEIVMDLDRHDSLFFGTYYYKKAGQTMDLDGTIGKNGKLVLRETDPQGNGSGAFTGTVSGSTFSGTWSNGKTDYTFSLTENYPAGSIHLLSAAFDSTAIIPPFKPKGESVSAVYHFDFLIADGSDKTAMNKINSSLYQDYISGQPPKTWDTTGIRKLAANDGRRFLREYRETYDTMKATTPSTDFENMLYSFNWSADASMSVKFNEENLLSVATIAGGYTGGAHGMYGCIQDVYNTKTGDTVALAQLFKPGYAPKLTQIAEQVLREQYKIAPGDLLSTAGFFVDKLELNDNYYVNRGGIGFFYNPYEITPWAMGPVDVFIPYAKLKDLIAPKGLIGWAAK